jgi:short-subunit dehydrogenase/MoaA/NifB/PqqE/SkfB family radical SAM enzyme
MKKYTFAKKVVLLTGATGGLGRELTHRLAREGAYLILTGRTLDELQELIASLPDPSLATAIDGNLTQPGEALRLAQEAQQLHGRIDVLVNNAGMGYFALVEEATDERIRQLFELNTLTPLTLMRELAEGMKERGSGRIINIASAAGRVPIPTVGIYGGSKSALAMIANTMRLELEPKGVTIINIYPGTINTSFEANAPRENRREGLDRSGQSGRSVEEIADKIIEASRGKGREVWLEREGRWMAAASLLWPSLAEQLLQPVRNRALAYKPDNKPHRERRWRLWQVESSIACNLSCVMCPWTEVRKGTPDKGLMSEAVWQAVRPHLPEIATIDFTGGGEPLLHPQLFDRLVEAKAEGCTAGFLTNGVLLDRELCERVLETGTDWVVFSVDSARSEIYQQIRRGAQFEEVKENIRQLTSMRMGKVPRVAINFVMMPSNIDQLEEMVRLARDLGVDQLNFKQCDVIKEESRQKFSLFAAKETKEQRQFKKALNRAGRLARRLNIKLTAFSFEPDEQPVCDQDPRNSMFVRYDGKVSPCIIQSYGGQVCFLGQPRQMPCVHYGTLPQDDPSELWTSETCQSYRETFSKRVALYDAYIKEASYGGMPYHFEHGIQRAKEEMTPPPDGCRYCHYLYDI